MRGSSIITLLLLFVAILADGQSVVNTVHNLSAGSGGIEAQTEDQVCIFCHTPHGSRPNSPLWNRNDPGGPYTLYNSTTLNPVTGEPDLPDGSSILCLSCHDGTIALGDVVSRTTDIVMAGGITTMPIGDANLELDLSDDHPVSYTYNTEVFNNDGELFDPSTIGPVNASSPIKLENGKIQCRSCHDPHKNIYTKFLVETNEFSTICIQCHNKTGWIGSSHENSTLNPGVNPGDPPWAHIDNAYATVGQNACENCHDPHNAIQNVRLLKAAPFENNCVDCHNGSIHAADIQSDMANRPATPTYQTGSAHAGYAYSLHDPATEGLTPTTSHVVCADCHNSHAVLTGDPLNGVSGINTGGSEVNPINNEYELCFRCHGSTFVTPANPPTPRQLPVGGSLDLIDDFQGTISSHPMLTPADGNGRALLPAWSGAGVTVQCSDCHASNNSAISGPHGSIYPRILNAYYNLNEFTDLPNNWNQTTLEVEFALCAQCHDMGAVENLHDTMKKGHILGYTTCNTCHDPHGFQGGTATLNSYLINLSTSPGALGPNGNGDFNITNNLDGTGTCNFTCHAKSHQHTSSDFK